MSQSPIRLQSVVRKTNVVDAIPIRQPKRLFECRYKPKETVNGCFEGEEDHGVFKVQGYRPQVLFRSALYALQSVHLHQGSEHIVEEDDKHDMELHFVHTPVGSSVAAPFVVIGVLFRTPENSAREVTASKAFSLLIESARTQACISFRPLDLFPKLTSNRPDTQNWFHYEGSLTSFPYSENVSWIVMQRSVEIDSATIVALKEHTKQHQREIQPLCRRLVVRSFLVDDEVSDND